ncbi:hypothetical protein I302_105362 [Kwoniella bestiolae CBS 10118]|uniref:F-box domain-containing protein n=1 Tax=Kwoniella bestiolae CBS 10118 TaxID=1296100 RepID=A0A1B9FSW7_9TREE|nr:hypothetical protein I302_08645 [Kwoniella bestiolae CBS 10118]OCF21866.1 hypothetical protein I302_08645 [Kwoniella bestiolae CBS 10118]
MTKDRPTLTATNGTFQPLSRSPQLPPEIWGRIITFLRRPMGSTGSMRNPNDYHQNDLAVAMRVNKMFYRYAAPTLYHRVIVSNFPLFLYGVPLLHPGDPPTIFDTPKTRLLKYVKRLDIAYSSLKPTGPPDNPLPHLILLHLNLPSAVIPPLTTDINNTYEVAKELLMGWAKSADASLLFPVLEVISTGGFGERLWDSYNPNFTKLDYTDMTTYQTTEEVNESAGVLNHLFKQQLFGRFLTGCSIPKRIVNYVSSGPMTPVYNRHFPNDHMLMTRLSTSDTYDATLPQSYTTHLLQQIYRGVWLNVAEGVVNRWVVDPIFRECRAETQMLVYTYIRGQLVTRRQLSKMLNMDKNTKIRVYGVLDPEMVHNVLPALVGNHGNFEGEYTDEEGLRTMKAYLGIGIDEEEDRDTFAEVELVGDVPGRMEEAGGEDEYL